jgi:hypothetical protein
MTDATEGIVDPYPVKDLPDRYGIGRTSLYSRLDALGIEPVRRGTKSYVSAAQVALLDQLRDHMLAGGMIGEFPPIRALSKQDYQERMGDIVESIDNPPELFVRQSANSLNERPQTLTEQASPQFGAMSWLLAPIAPTLDRIATQLEALTSQRQDPFAYYRQLEEFAQNGWLIKSNELGALLGVSPSTIAGYGQQFEAAGFLFTRSGKRGRITEWRISKISVQPDKS